MTYSNAETQNDQDLNALIRFYHKAPLAICVLAPAGASSEPVYTNPEFDRACYNLALLHKAAPSQRVIELTSQENGTSDMFCVQELSLESYDRPCRIAWQISQRPPESQGPEKDSKFQHTSGQFLATMSHEIRSPMQSVFGMLELIDTKNSSQILAPMISTAKNAAGNVLEILDDILDLAKMNADMFVLDDYEVPVRTLVSGIIEAMAIKTRNKPIELKEEIDSAVPAVIRGDPKRLRQVLMNLCSNAVKFTEQGHVTICVSCEPLTGPKNSKDHNQENILLKFEIKDTGIGIPRATQDKLFSPFTQADSSTARKYGGTGLGLSISQKLVKMMGGEISIESQEGHGSNFYFSLPVKIVAQSSPDHDLSPINDGARPLEGLQVLSVEDHPKAAQEIRGSLESAGAHVTSCQTLTDARKALARHPYDIGVIDQGLPDGLGIDLVSEIAQVYPSMAILMYTARQDDGLEYTLKSLGAGFLSKPASRQGLISKIAENVRLPESSRIKGTGRVLLVDDTSEVRMVFKQQFEHLGVESDFAESAAEAINYMQKKPYDMVITDFHMPEMDGADLANIIHSGGGHLETGVNTPVIGLSADVNIARKDDYQEKGFQEYLTKPVSMAQLQRLFIRWGILSLDNDFSITYPNKDSDISKNKAREKRQNEATDLTDAQIIPHIDIKELSRQTGQSKREIKTMLNFFIRSAAQRYEGLCDAYDNRDINRLTDQAHSLKGAALSVCAHNLAEIADQLQNLNEKSYTKGWPLLQKIDAELTQLGQIIESANLN